MVFKVAVVSTETIKPSSPTPHHLRTHKLSWIDQLAPLVHISLVLFYSHIGGCCDGGESTSEKIRRLRVSLSETLTLFYPLAGRMEGSSTMVNCNDDGVDFFEARVSLPLAEVLQQLEVETPDRLLPCDRRCTGGGGGPLLAVQANLFDCGGIAVGACVSHKIADGMSLIVFLNAWAAVARGDSEEVVASHPTFDSASIFPPRKAPPVPIVVPDPKEKSVITKRFVLDASKISALRTKTDPSSPAAPAAATGSPTRVEAVSALVWRCITRARGDDDGPSARASVATHVVNVRRRMQPRLPDSAFGNLWVVAVAPGIVGEITVGTSEEQLSGAIRKIDGDYISGNLLAGGSTAAMACRKLPVEALLEKYSGCGVDFCHFSSFCGFPVYETDFGWGKPVWVGRGSLHFRNSVTLMGRREGDGGMEAWVSMAEKEMSRFEQDQELLSLVVSSPSIPLSRIIL